MPSPPAPHSMLQHRPIVHYCPTNNDWMLATDQSTTSAQYQRNLFSTASLSLHTEQLEHLQYHAAILPPPTCPHLVTGVHEIIPRHPPDPTRSTTPGRTSTPRSTTSVPREYQARPQNFESSHKKHHVPSAHPQHQGLQLLAATPPLLTATRPTRSSTTGTSALRTNQPSSHLQVQLSTDHHHRLER